MQNIGIAFVKLGQYNEAITSFEHVLAEEPNFVTGFNLILCYFAKGDKCVKSNKTPLFYCLINVFGHFQGQNATHFRKALDCRLEVGRRRSIHLRQDHGKFRLESFH